MADEIHPATQVPADAVRRAMARLLASYEFRTSNRSQQFLRYVVASALDGNGPAKERTIAIDVLGKPASYDTREDAAVRVAASDVRRRLNAYYETLGADDEVVIELPQGGYAPRFRFRDTPQAESATPDLAEAPEAPEQKASQSHPASHPVLLSTAVISCAAIASFLILHSSLSRSDLDDFWDPILTPGNPVVLCVEYLPIFPADPSGTVRAEPPKVVRDLAVAGGDVAAVSRLSSVLAKHGRGFRLLLGDDASFTDFRSSPTILVGYAYTRWGAIKSQSRFTIGGTRPGVVLDRGVPTEWVLHAADNEMRVDTDYAVVTRQLRADTGAPLIEVAGILHYGTEAAAEFVTDSDLFQRAARLAPRDWRTRNVQFVLRVRVVEGRVGTPVVVASHVW